MFNPWQYKRHFLHPFRQNFDNKEKYVAFRTFQGGTHHSCSSSNELTPPARNLLSSFKYSNHTTAKNNEWMLFKAKILHCKDILVQGQPGLIRLILLWIVPLEQDQSLDLLTSSPACYHCATDAPYSKEHFVNSFSTVKRKNLPVGQRNMIQNYSLLTYHYCCPLDWQSSSTCLQCPWTMSSHLKQYLTPITILDTCDQISIWYGWVIATNRNLCTFKCRT